MPRILIIDDDSAICRTIQRGFASEGLAVDAARSGPEGLTAAHTLAPDLVILDLALPELDGFAVLEELRRTDPRLPVLMLTGRDAAADQIKGLACGADDYMTKPFTFDVLLARIKALLRRCETDRPPVMRFDDLTLDTGARCAQRGTRTIDLTTTEYELLRQLVLHARRVVSKHALMERVWGFAMEGRSNVVEVYVKQLRQKLESDGEPRLIHTIRGAGYVLRQA